jgi:hypothetical protein
MITMTLRNPVSKRDLLPIYIETDNTELALDWQVALAKELMKNTPLEKNYCWHGWADTQRDLEYLCEQLNQHVKRLNDNLEGYETIEYVDEDEVFKDLEINHDIMNKIHNHFEHLQGTVGNMSSWYKQAVPEVKYSIRQLNNLCHEIENLCLSMRKKVQAPEWQRPSQITTFLNAKRYSLNSEHRKGFLTNGYDRKFGYVYMHWAQIGKTLYEVFRDEHGAAMTNVMCDAVTHLEYYSGEFDIEWGQDVVYGNAHPWHTTEMDSFQLWLKMNGFDANDPMLSLGYLEIGKVNLIKSFGTDDRSKIWEMMSRRLDIYSIECLGHSAVYDYSWSDLDYEQQQIDFLMPGYRSHV